MALNLTVKQPDFHYRIIKITLFVFFIADALNKIIIVKTGNTQLDYSPSLFSRLLFELFAIFVIVTNPDKKRVFFLVTVLLLLSTYVLGVSTYLFQYDRSYNYFYHLSLFNKYIFLFVTYFFIYKLRDNDRLLTKLLTVCEFLFIVNSLAVIIGVIFNIPLFRSYVSQDYRFGFNGFIPAVNESTLFYVIALSFFYYKRFILNIKSRFSFIIVIGALFIGAKGVYFFMVCLALFHFLAFSTVTAKAKMIIIGCVAIIGGIFLFNEFQPTILDHFIYLANKNGVISMLLTGRDAYLKSNFLYNMDYWTVVNYFFGGQDQRNFLIEMDLFDTFLFFGILGGLIYLSLFFQSVFNINLKKKFNLFFILMYFFLAALGGHFFASALNSLYLVLFCLFIYNSDARNIDLKTDELGI